uniref:BED-type domain-containing protein n=1 Tax=Ditylenchus dipsaci TaxID=166011 RepID=A0A915CQF3_9BILA
MLSINYSRCSSVKKRHKNTIWDMFEKEEDSHGEIKWKCSECQQRLSNHQTSVARHWESKHREKPQPAKKLCAQIAEESSKLKSRYHFFHCLL